MNKTLITLILMCIPSIAYGQSQVSIALGSGYAGGTVVVTTVNPNGSTAPIRSTFLDGNGASVLSWLPTGAKNIITVCKIDNTSCLGTVAQPTGNVQDITAALQANPIGSGSSVFPLTISGTVNSGGIPCFTSTTNEASSATITADALIYGGGAGSCIAVLSAPTGPNGVPEFLNSLPSAGAAAAPAFTLSGVPIDARTTTTETVLGTCTPTPCTQDRSSLITFNNGSATALTVPQPGATNFTNNFNFAAANINTGLVTATPTSSTVNGNATQIIPYHWFSYWYNDSSNWRAGTFPDIAAFPNSPTNALGFTSATGAFGSITALTATSVATGASPPTCTVGTAGALCLNEGTAPTGASSVDDMYANSTNHCADVINNNVEKGCLAIGTVAAITSADWTCGTGGTISSCTSAQTIGTLTFTLPLAAVNWTVTCDGVVGQATGVTANSWNIQTATNGATNLTASYSMNTAATAMTGGAVTDVASTTTTQVIAPTWTLGGTGTKMPFHIAATVEGASASGTVVNIQLVAPTVGDLVTIYRGAACVGRII